MFQAKICRENQNTHFIFNSFCPKIKQFIRTAWKNVVQPDGPHDNTMLRRKVALCMMDN
jgi:hypothetical protein